MSFPRASSVYSSAGAVESLCALPSSSTSSDPLVASAHASGAVEVWRVGGGVAARPLRLPQAPVTSGARLACISAGLRADGEAFAVVGDAGGALRLLSPLRAGAGGVAVGTGWRGVSAVDVHAAQQHDLVAAGDGHAGRVAVYSAAQLGSPAPTPLWAGSLAGGAGPAVSALRWWPFSPTTLACAGGASVSLIDTRAPPGAPHATLLAPSRATLTGLTLSSEQPWAAYACAEDGAVLAWDVRMGEVPASRAPAQHVGPAWGVAALVGAQVRAARRDQPLLVSVGQDGAIVQHAGRDAGALASSLEEGGGQGGAFAADSVLLARVGVGLRALVVVQGVIVAAGEGGCMVSVG